MKSKAHSLRGLLSVRMPNVYYPPPSSQGHALRTRKLTSTYMYMYMLLNEEKLDRNAVMKKRSVGQKKCFTLILQRFAGGKSRYLPKKIS